MNTQELKQAPRSYFEAWGPVMGSCGHRHRTPEAAQRCIEATARAIRRSPYCGAGAYCDRKVQEVDNG